MGRGPRGPQPRIASQAAIIMAVTMIVGCGEPIPSAPTESPAAPPLLFPMDWSADNNGRWTFNVSVNPRGSPTDVILEYGFGPESAPVFDTTMPVEEDMFDPQAVTVTVDMGEGRPFCARFTATNEIGSVSTEPRCPYLPAIPPAKTGGASASP
jgi:hypothetical protein